MKKKTIILIALFFFAFFLKMQAQWQLDTRLTNDNALSLTSDIYVCSNNVWCVAATGNDVHVTWCDYRNNTVAGEIYYKKSTDGGISWGADVQLTNDPASSLNPSIAVFNSVVHVVWQEKRDGNYEIYYKRSTDGGLSWSIDTRLTNALLDSWNPSIAVSGLVVHVVWQDNRDGNFEIYYKNSSDGGLTWGYDTRLTNNVAYSFRPVVAVSGSAVHVAWHDTRDGNHEIYYKHSTDGGITWGADTRLTNNSAVSFYPSIAVSGSDVHVVWNDFRDGNSEIYYKRSTDGGNAWSSDIRLTNDMHQSRHTSIAVCDSNVNVVWDDDQDGDFEVFYKQSTDGGTIWNADLQLTNNFADSLAPSVAICSSGIHVVWTDFRDQNDEIYYKRNLAGCTAGTSLCGQKYNDLNGNGVRDPGEPGIPNWTISLSGTNSSTSTCGSPITKIHVQGAVAPVNKTVTYGTVTNIPGEPTKCWITRNLGADQQASAVDDPSEPSAGWYWQFNRKQGYKNDGINPISPSWTITSISESSDWLPANDPCTIELGGDWRIPTMTEWTNVNAAGGWFDWDGPFNSDLKLHAAGMLSWVDGSNSYRGTKGRYYSSSQFDNDYGYDLGFDDNDCGVAWNLKAWADPLRCLRDALSSTTTTDQDGNFCFHDLLVGSYTVSEVMHTSWVQTEPPYPGTYFVNLAAGQNIDSLEFGNQHDTCQSGSKTWSPLGSGFNGQVKALAVMGGELYAGGDFSLSGTTSVHNIAKWNGSGWSALGSGLNGFVSSLAVIGSDLYAGGNFTSSGSLTVNSIAKWNGTSWSGLSNGITGTVRALAEMGGQLYAGGTFATAGSVTANSIAKWDGTNWSAVGGGTNGYVSALAVNGGNLYIGGTFTSVGGGSVGASNIAKWDGTSWSALGSGTGNSVNALIMMGGNLYAAGKFLTAGGPGADYVAKWDGTNWYSLVSGMNGYLYSLCVSGTDLYAGGDITTAGGSGALKIAKWDGTSWSPLGGGMNSNGVFAIAMMGTNLYAGGMFTTAGGISANNIAKYGCGGSSGIDDGNTQPDSQLEQNYPNPFNSSTTIRYVIRQRSSVKISVYNFLGEEIRELVNVEKNPGTYKVVFDAKELKGGIYYYTIRTGNYTQSKKMILVK